MATSPYAAKPTSLKNPVPDVSADDILNDVMNFKPAEIVVDTAASAQQGTPTAEPSADDILNDVMGVSTPAPEPMQAQPGVPAADEEAEPSFAQANLRQFQDFTTRLQAGLAANDVEKANFLKQKFGDGNVRVSPEGVIRFRKGSGEKFRKLDPDTLEVINDIIPDFAREIITEVGLLPFELGGAAAAGGPVGAYGGRIAGTIPANMFADTVAEAAGVPQDANRSKFTENAIGMGMEAVLPVVGKQILKRLPGTAAYKAAKEAGEREIVALSKQSKEVAQAAFDLAQEGRAAKIDGAVVGVPGANVNLMGFQLQPDNPKLQQLGLRASGDPRFINAQRQLAEDWGKSLENTMLEVARQSDKGPVSPEHLAKSVTNAVDDLERTEGQAIGKYRAKAMAKLGNSKEALPQELQQATQNLMQQFGFRPRTIKSINKSGSVLASTPKGITPAVRDLPDRVVWEAPKNLKELVGTKGLTKVGEVRSVINALNELGKVQTSGGARLTDLDRLVTVIGDLNPKLANSALRGEWGSLSAAMRQVRRGRIEKGLSTDFEKKAFNQSMDDFSLIRENVSTLKNVLDEEASAKAIVTNIFTGKQNLPRIRAIKSLSPESFGALKEEWVTQQLQKFASRESPTGYNSGQFLDALNKQYGPEFMREVLDGGPGPNSDTIKKILTVTDRIEKQYKGVKVDQMTEETKKGAMNLLIGLMGDIKFKTTNGITSLLKGAKGQDNVLLEIMTRDGIDKYVAQYPGRGMDKAKISQQLTNMLAESRAMKMLGKTVDNAAVKRTGKRAAVSATARDKSQPQMTVEEDQP